MMTVFPYQLDVKFYPTPENAHRNPWADRKTP